MSGTIGLAQDNRAALASFDIPRQRFLGTPFDKITFTEVLKLIGETQHDQGFRYIVTPNVDHVVRLARHPELSVYYDNAWLTLCDSKPIVLLARAMPMILPRVTGSDLTVCLFNQVIRAGHKLALIAPSQQLAETMRSKNPHLQLRVHVPPLGVAENPEELAKCVEFVLREKADFIFIAIGSPQSEIIAHALSRDARASGTCLCIGASLEFMTGMKKRAPRWMTKVGVEWVHRLASDPKRLWRRYVFAAPPLMRLAAKEVGQSWASRILGRR